MSLQPEQYASPSDTVCDRWLSSHFKFNIELQGCEEGWLKIGWGALKSESCWRWDPVKEHDVAKQDWFHSCPCHILGRWQINFWICFIIYKMGPLLPWNWISVNVKYYAPIKPLINLVSLSPCYGGLVLGLISLYSLVISLYNLLWISPDLWVCSIGETMWVVFWVPFQLWHWF